jgi:protein-tyrosine kinase
MSIIESEFLKTLKNSKDEIKNQTRKSNPEPPVAPNDNLESKDILKQEVVKNVISAKKHISTMSQKNKYSAKELGDRNLISTSTSDAALLNEYRNLRTKLLVGQTKSNFTTLVTSISAGYDVSLVVANIAMAFALDSSKTSLVINADTENTKLNNLFDVDNDLGIIDYLESDDLEIDEILCETPISRLRYMPCGKSHEDVSEYFTTSRMTGLVKTLIERYPERFPVICAPSIESSADARILIDSCDCVVLVAGFGKCNESEIRHAMLTVGSEKFAGIILDDF